METIILSISPYGWGVLALSSFIIGMSKTWIQGFCLIAIPLLAMAFGAKESTGLILPILCFADLVAVFYYRNAVRWMYILKALPFALLGFFVALAVDKLIPPAAFKYLMGICLLVVLAVILLFERACKDNRLIHYWWYGPLWGVLGGFTTMIGNAAGPVLAIYLLSLKMPKYSFVGTSAYFFLILNYLKLPLQIWAWKNITADTLLLDACTIPFILLGGIVGCLLVKRMPEKSFRHVTTAITFISAILLLI